ncbi:MAG TPA: DUF5681 domain-containing protein, partial [Xanthobacteraceae bacterium]|nr:DUF5681 domain-containing protein [Xanthobacteraceae bacterium]
MLAAERTATGRFAPGRSGNPAGRPPGSRNRSTMALEDALAVHTEELVDLLLRSAADGKGAALRICFDRIAPLRKGRPVPFELPTLACHADLVAAASAIVAGMADGELTPAEAQDMFKVLEAFHKVLTLPARQAPAAGADANRRPGETCQSTGFAAGAGDENVEALDPVPTSPATVHRPAPPAAAETSRQPTPAETCKSPRPEAGPDDEDAGTRDPTSMAMPDPAPPLIAEATRQPQEPVQTCKSPESDAGGSDDNGGHGAAPDPAGTGTDALATGTGNSEPPRDPPVPVRTPLIASSGDPIADRRYGRARDYEEAGDLPAAAELLLQALQRAPHFASAWFALGDIRERLRDRDGAIAAFRQALDADRGDPHGAGLRLVRLGTSGPGRPMSPGYVRALFDQMAPRFEAELVG